MNNESVNNIGIIYLIFAISLLGMGLLASIRDGQLFYVGVCGINIIAWVIALLIED